MRWGFGWELGPFEIMGRHRPARGARRTSCRRAAARCCERHARDRPAGAPTCRSCESAKDRQRGRPAATPARASSTSATACWRVEFHSKMNAIGGDTDPDAARRREGSRRELRGARRRQRRAEFFGRRQPDAAAARGAGRQLGRDRPDDPRVPGRDPGAALRRRAGRRRAGGPDARRRLRDRAARRPRAGGGGKLHRPRRSRRRADSRRRRHEGDARASGRRPAADARRPAAVRPAGVRDDRLREGVDQRRRRAAARLPRRTPIASR